MEHQLKFIIGPSGSGKSETLFREVTELAKENPGKKYIILVPEQFTMATQKKIVEKHPRHAVANIDIVSFHRLCLKVFSELGVEDTEVLDDTGKSLILRKVIAEESRKLQVYRDKIHMHGFVEEMKSVISELYLYGIDSEEFERMQGLVSDRPMISAKLKDIGIIYQGFADYINGRYITKEELLKRFCYVVPDSQIIAKSEIYFDGFTGFTPVQNELVSLFLRYAPSVTVTVTAGAEELKHIRDGIRAGEIPVREQELFKMSKDMLNVLLAGYHKNHPDSDFSEILERTIFTPDSKNGRFASAPALEHLEKNLFRGFASQQPDNGAVKIMHFDMPSGEVEAVTNEIAYQVRTKKMRYRDFAIITGDMDGYGKLLADNLEMRGIPYFMDNKRSLILNPAVAFIRAILEVIDKDFSYESVFRFLKCGIPVLGDAEGIREQEQTDLLENYAVALGIRGYGRYKEPFKRKMKNMTDEELEVINGIRERFVSATEEIYEALHGKKLTVDTYCRRLYDFMVKFRIAVFLKAQAESFGKNHMQSLEKEYTQTYAHIINLMDQFVNLLGDEEMSLQEFREILDAGFEEIKVGIIPPGLDLVTVGDIERTRLEDIKVLFVLGANDGVIPNKSKKSSLLSQSDRQQLKNANVQLSPTIRESLFIQTFYLYLNLTKPSEQLMISYTESGTDGTILRPSYLIGEVKRLFRWEKESVRDCKAEGITEKEECTPDVYEKKLSSGAFALKYLAEQLNRNHISDMNDFEKELYSYFYRKPEYRERIRQIQKGIFFDNEPTSLGKLVAEQLNGDGMVRSVSRLERYAACAYAHFLNYSMKLKERERYEVNAADLGTIYHRCIELFSHKVMKSGMEFQEIEQEQRDRWIEECVSEVTADYGNTILQSSKRNEYLIRKIMTVCKKSAWAICEHLKRGKYKPQEFEFAFSQGRIDRIDTYEEDGKIYLKIIDYKTGKKKFDLSEAFDGLQMQLIFYLGEAVKVKRAISEGKEIVPAGTFYFQIKSPYVECSERIEDAELSQLLLKEYKMSGLVNDTKEAAIAMDEKLKTEKEKSQIIPLEEKELNQWVSSSGFNSDNMERMITYIDHQMDQFTDEILDGKIDKNPYRKGDKTPCTYCVYHSICNFDEREFDNHYRQLGKLSDPKEILKKLTWYR